MMLENLWLGLLSVLTPVNMLVIVFGVMAGILAGALPGINPSTALALLVPFTYAMSPLTGLITLCAVYTAAEYGGSISAITINVPGTTMAAATVLDGYPLTQKGKVGKALGISLISSVSGGLISTILLILLSFRLVKFALLFGPPEFFALGLFGLSVVASLTEREWVKGLISAALGLLVATIGTDPFSGVSRLTGNSYLLSEGIPLIPALIGLFAVSQVFVIAAQTETGKKVSQAVANALPTWDEIKSVIATILRSSFIGTFIGAMPGAGGTIASFIAYNEAKRFSKKKDEFGHGALEGVAAPEAANNATVGGALMILLTLGIPGSPSTAVLVGGLTIHGLQPGPHLFSENAALIYGLFASLLIINIALLVIGLLGTKIWTKVPSIPKIVMAPIMFLLALIGSYAVSNNMFNVWLALIFGVIGFFMRRWRFPITPMVLGIVLGFLIETSFRRSMIISDGSYAIFFTRPITVVLFLMTIASIVYAIIRSRKASSNGGQTSVI